MSGAILPIPQYAFMAWCSVKAQGQLYPHLYLTVFVCNALISEIIFFITEARIMTLNSCICFTLHIYSVAKLNRHNAPKTFIFRNAGSEYTSPPSSYR
jgi:hypothetical protein